MCNFLNFSNNEKKNIYLHGEIDLWPVGIFKIYNLNKMKFNGWTSFTTLSKNYRQDTNLFSLLKINYYFKGQIIDFSGEWKVMLYSFNQYFFNHIISFTWKISKHNSQIIPKFLFETAGSDYLFLHLSINFFL